MQIWGSVKKFQNLYRFLIFSGTCQTEMKTDKRKGKLGQECFKRGFLSF